MKCYVYGNQFILFVFDVQTVSVGQALSHLIVFLLEQCNRRHSTSSNNDQHWLRSLLYYLRYPIWQFPRFVVPFSMKKGGRRNRNSGILAMVHHHRNLKNPFQIYKTNISNSSESGCQKCSQNPCAKNTQPLRGKAE